MKKGLIRWLVICLLAVLVSPLSSAYTLTSEKAIKIGVIGPMQFMQGEHHWHGAKMAAGEINEAGGILVGEVKRPIRLVKIDSNEIRSVPDAANAMERAITREKVDFLVGGFRTEAVLVMQNIAADHKKVFMGCGSAHPKQCERVAENYEKYKYWFRVTPVNSNDLGKASFLQLGMVGNVVREKLGIEKPKVAVIAEKAIWADPIVKAAREIIPSMGMEVAGNWRPSATATDITAELVAIKNAGSQIIFHVFSGPVGVSYGKQWGELQIPAASAGINVEAMEEGFWDATVRKGNYETTLHLYGPAEITPKTMSFWDRFVKERGEFPSYNAGTYDAVYILKEAVEKAGTLDSDAVVSKLEKTDFLGASGRTVFTQDHDLTWGPGYITTVSVQWQDGGLRCVWPWEWEGITYKGTVRYKLPPRVVEYWS